MPGHSTALHMCTLSQHSLGAECHDGGGGCSHSTTAPKINFQLSLHAHIWQQHHVAACSKPVAATT